MERLMNTLLNFIDNEIDDYVSEFPENEIEQKRKEAYARLKKNLV